MLNARDGESRPSYQELLDESLGMTFPASDPIAVSACGRAGHRRSSRESLLDDAIELTFPASDPVATSSAAANRNEVDWVLGDEPRGNLSGA